MKNNKELFKTIAFVLVGMAIGHFIPAIPQAIFPFVADFAGSVSFEGGGSGY